MGTAGVGPAGEGRPRGRNRGPAARRRGSAGRPPAAAGWLALLLGCLLGLVLWQQGVLFPDRGAPAISVSRGASLVLPGTEGLRFAGTPVGQVSAVDGLAIGNTGDAPLEVKALSLAGDAAEFRLEPWPGGLPATLEPGAGRALYFRFAPSSLGTKVAEVLITSDHPDESRRMYRVTITGAAVAAASPRGVRARAESGRVTVSWDPVPGAVSYNLYLSPQVDATASAGGAAGAGEVFVLPDVQSPFVVTGLPGQPGALENGRAYRFSVTAAGASGESRPSEEVVARPARTFYVDATLGDDAGDGLSPERAWRSLRRVNASSLRPGEYVLFRRGEVWNDEGLLAVPSSGAEGLPITFGAYGSGPRPVFSAIGPVPGWDDPDNWTRASDDGSVWSISYGPWKVAKRVWLSGTEYAAAQVPGEVDATYRWHFDLETELLHVYTGGSNPALRYTGIEEAMARSGSVLRLRERHYVTVRDLDLRGGLSCVSVLGSNHFTLEDCDVAWGTGSIGIWVSRLTPEDASDYGIIRRCLVDSGYHIPHYYYEKAQTEDGIHLRDNADHWRIYDNDIRNWGHTGVDLWQASEGTTVSCNSVYRNTFTARDIAYGRAFSTKGRPGGCQYNRFYHNTVSGTSVQIQIGGEHNFVCYNVIDTMVNESVYGERGAQGIALTPAMGRHTDFVSNFNHICNNVIYRCPGAGIDIQDWQKGYSIRHNVVRNNIILDCGYDSLCPDTRGVGLSVGNPGERVTGHSNIIENNLVYSAGVSATCYYRGRAVTVGELNALNGTWDDTMAGNIGADPLLIDPANGDFRPGPLSPCMDAGVPSGRTEFGAACGGETLGPEVDLDFAGTPVPRGVGVDIGAYEFR